MSHLQRVAGKINWLLGYRLQTTSIYDLTEKHLGFKVSQYSMDLLIKRNEITKKLCEQLETEYKTYAKQYRKRHSLPKPEKQFDG